MITYIKLTLLPPFGAAFISSAQFLLLEGECFVFSRESWILLPCAVGYRLYCICLLFVNYDSSLRAMFLDTDYSLLGMVSVFLRNLMIAQSPIGDVHSLVFFFALFYSVVLYIHHFVNVYNVLLEWLVSF